MPIRRRRTRRMRGGSVPNPVGTTAKNSAYQILRRPTRTNIFGRLADIHQGLRNNQTISNYLTNKGWGRLGRFASMLGYGKRRTVRRRTYSTRSRLTGGRRLMSRRRLTGGRKRRTTRRRTMRGGSIWGDIWGGIKNVGNAVVSPVANFAVNRLLGGRRRRTTKRRLVGGRKRRVGRPKNVGRRMQKGRGLFDSAILKPFSDRTNERIVGAVRGFLGAGKRKVVRRKVVKRRKMVGRGFITRLISSFLPI